MGKSRRLAAFLFLCVLFLAGCGNAKVPDSIEASTIAVGKKGEIRLWQVGEFDHEDYLVEELRAMAVEEAARFNLARQEDRAAAVEKVEVLEGGRVIVEYRFERWESCTDFLDETVFYGTLKEAQQNGYDTRIVMELKSVKDGSLPEEGALEGWMSRFLVITDIKADVYCPGKVVYISDGAVLNEDGSVDTSGVEGVAYILLK